MNKYDKAWLERFSQGATQAMHAQHQLVTEMAMHALFGYVRRASQGDRHYNDPKRKWMAVESNFKIPFELPSGTTTYLNGKIDGAFLSGKKIWLFETKNLGRIDESNIVEMLPFNFQLNLYMYALSQVSDHSIGGALYNITRRPGQRQGATEPNFRFLGRIAEDIAKRPDHYFMRFEVPTDRGHIDNWSFQVLEPILLDMERWWNSIKGGSTWEDTMNTYPNPSALVSEYGRCSMFNIIVRNDRSGHYIRNTPFPELEF